ncbi:insulysin, insulin-degrading enzyme, putative (macronuclear) [Tetrahymena thermophila SB210]|uniref:Insulysin, insulin-degrading enzyme, putative n=1 Tax=Tetrahymena thermophila (strain SB210) TaxID=312017 RepID=W7XJC2_TETTS|nr:insulysin, insulin-degrading enzyme, putative [Tetrahymena thermophila SB210]EWS75396.1 insulysin, insulin-degrading enzyme, putative [Tetrahymena thermophila SB210]|eukprot:XP_012652070.1 insulysin, insulin-degrading enzyme, putative [Tetrahymena thermophila SB210]
MDQQLKIYCKKHKKYQARYFNVSEEAFQELKCEECITEENSSLKDHLSIEIINICDDDQIFPNWPPVNDIKLLKNISSIMIKENETLEELDLQFQQMIADILKIIEEMKKKWYSYLTNKNQQKVEILNSYNEISGKERLKQLINFTQQTMEDQLNDLRFKFNEHIADQLIIGVLNENNLSLPLSSSCQGKAFGKSNLFCGGQVVKGSYFQEIKKDQVIEMRIDIQNKKLQFLDYPNYQNINELQDCHNNLNQNNKHNEIEEINEEEEHEEKDDKQDAEQNYDKEMEEQEQIEEIQF